MNSDEAIKRLNIYSIRNNCLKLDRETYFKSKEDAEEFMNKYKKPILKYDIGIKEE